MTYRVISVTADRLGECPLWCDRTKSLYWVDVLAPALWRYTPATGEIRSHEFRGRRLGSIALRRRGGLLLACDDGLYGFDPETGSQEFLVDPEPGMTGHRKNDGRADPAGNFWIGTLRETDYAPVGALYRIAPDLSVSVEAEHLAIPNALAFDAEAGRMYFADTRAYTIWVCDLDIVSGAISNRRIFAKTRTPARPDGSCIDAEGYLWNAEYAGGRLLRFSPGGELVTAIELPFTYPTCCCFGGENLDVLFVTSAAGPMSAQERLEQPDAGRLVALDVGVRGRPEYETRL